MTIGSAFSAGPFAVAQAQEASGQQIVISLDQARDAARRAIQAGEFAIAEELANGLLQANPNDADALIIIAVSAQAGQQYVRQADFAGRAFQEAETDIQRFEAAMLSAQAFFALGRYGWSQVWLRLASENAPNEETLELVRNNYAQAARVNPWRNRFTFSISPSSNVNNGSRDRILEIGGLPFTLSADARALAGVRARIGFNTRYRYAQTQISESYLRFAFFVERVRLTAEAQAEAPDAEGDDFAFDAVEIGWGHIRAAGSGGTHQVDLAGGKNWYGGLPLSDFVRASYRRALPVSDRQLLGASFSLEEQWRLDAPIRSATTARAGVDWTQRRGNGDTWSLVSGLRRVASDSPEIDHTAARVAVSYLIGRRIGPTRWDLEADVEVRDYPENPFDPSGREDLRWRVGATVGFPDAELYGYFPTLTVEARRVDSNVSLYNIDEVGFRVGIRSIF